MPRKTLGITTVQVLHAVSLGKRYGFDIMDATGLPSGTVYPALSRLERTGMLRAKWESHQVAQRQKRPPRKYYQITREGRARLAEATERIRAVERTLSSDANTREATA
ncbi:MAG: PadR family transcriptional regulator [Gemmatimonadota bacterium]|nr:PadR family transcriptional regulator [Gemmatimonadota bacterium]